MPEIAHPAIAEPLAEAAAFVQRLGLLPVVGQSDASLLSDYQGVINRLVADIDAAREHVHLLFYIFANDSTGRRVIDALKRAAARGVECRVLAVRNAPTCAIILLLSVAPTVRGR